MSAAVQLSIVIPTLNESAGIERAVLRARRLTPVEIIIADGGSTDGTIERADQLACRVIHCPRGRANQQNDGAASATGDVLLFLHADSWLEPRARQQMEQVLRSPSIPGGAFRHRFETSHPLMRLIELGDSLRVCLTRVAFGDQGIFLRRDVFHSLGGFPTVRLMEDVLLCRRVRDVGRLALLPGPLHTSARRHLQYGVIRQTLRNWSILTAERLGISPDQLAAFYSPHWKEQSASDSGSAVPFQAANGNTNAPRKYTENGHSRGADVDTHGLSDA